MVLHVRLHTKDKKLLFVAVQGHLVYSSGLRICCRVNLFINVLIAWVFLFHLLGSCVVKLVELLALEFCICQEA